MIDPAIAAVAVAGIALIVTLAATIWNNSWNLSGKLENMRADLLTAINKHKQEIDSRLDAGMQQTGEAVRAVRELYHQQEKSALIRHNETSERISSIENWARDEFVRKQTLDRLLTDVRGTIETSTQRMEKGLDQVRQALIDRPRSTEDRS